MIKPPVESTALVQLRERTSSLLSTEIADDNGLMADLHEIGYLKQPVEGYLGAMAIYFDGQVEFFADTMPGKRGLTSNGGSAFHYQSIHDQLIRKRDVLNNMLPQGLSLPYSTGLIVKTQGGLYYSDKYQMRLSEKWKHRDDDIESAIKQALGEVGLIGEITPKTLVNDDYNSLVELATPTSVLRIAAKWKEKTLTPPYDPDTDEDMDEVLSHEQALAGLSLELSSLVYESPQRDIDIIRAVMMTGS